MQITGTTLGLMHNGQEISIELPALAEDSMVRIYAVPTEYRENGIFVSVTSQGSIEEVPACDFTAASHLQNLAYPANGAARLDAAKLQRLREINAACDKAVFALTSTYPQAEIQSWPQQVKEADTFVENPDTEVPLLEAIGSQRGLSVEELVDRVHAKVRAYAVASGHLIGHRQSLEDAIDAADSLETLVAVAWDL